jgi:L-histidine N-alpha-methyltransferase
VVSLAPITIAVHTLGRDSRVEFIDDVRQGLTRTPKTLQPRWFYDDRGCELFDEITLLPEYYQTRTEMAILQRHARDIMERVRPASIVEVGAGSCTKSRVLIRAAKGMGSLWTFVPFDISEATLRRSATELSEEFDDLTVYCVTGEFDHHLSQIPRFGRQLIVFLGSTIGNFEASEAQRFLSDVRRLMRPGDHFLIGVDLVKEPAQLIAAYDDSRGITADFNRNLLTRINRELEGDFDVEAFSHAILWNGPEHRIEMYLRSNVAQTVTVRGADLVASFNKDEMLRTEVCTKYTRSTIETMLQAVGVDAVDWYTDPENRFGLLLAR